VKKSKKHGTDYQSLTEQVSLAAQTIHDGDLRNRMQAVAQIAQLWIRNGGNNVFIAAVMRGRDGVVVMDEVTESPHDMALKARVIERAYETTADSLVVVYEAWMAPSEKLADQASFLPPSLHPQKEEVLVVLGKDHWEQICWVYPLHRSGTEVFFGEIASMLVFESFLDEYRILNQTVHQC
jgi:hypothetical protein